MGWVRHVEVEPAVRECEPPMHAVTYALPSHSPTGNSETTEYTERQVDGQIGDLWRCDCRRLWRAGHACDACDQYGVQSGLCPRGGYHVRSLAWRPARWWQRLIHPGGD